MTTAAGYAIIGQMKLSPELYVKYVADPLGMDAAVRNAAKVPEDRYYSVSTWPEERAGVVTVNTKDYRKVAAKKISKSDQQT